MSGRSFPGKQSISPYLASSDDDFAGLSQLDALSISTSVHFVQHKGDGEAVGGVKKFFSADAGAYTLTEMF